MKLIYLICFCFNCVFANDKIPINELKKIIFYKNQYTNHRRENPIPQINIKNDQKFAKFNVSMIECNAVSKKNNNFSEMLWKCESDISKYCNLIDYNIICDEYNNSYIIKNSCRINYNLTCKKLKDKGFNAFLTVSSMLFLISILHTEINKLTLFTIFTYLIITSFISALFNIQSYSLIIFSITIYIGKVFNRVML